MGQDRIPLDDGSTEVWDRPTVPGCHHEGYRLTWVKVYLRDLLVELGADCNIELQKVDPKMGLESRARTKPVIRSRTCL